MNIKTPKPKIATAEGSKAEVRKEKRRRKAEVRREQSTGSVNVQIALFTYTQVLELPGVLVITNCVVKSQ
jgi:hypothetical protein